MKLIHQTHEILEISKDIPQMIEKAGRTCYKTENKITSNSAGKFVKMLCDKGHDAMIEFGDMTVRFITNRGVTHELVRHRLCSFAQESTRYVRYDGNMEFIWPVWIDEKHQGYREFIDALELAEARYCRLLQLGWRPEQAREVLPNALKTEIVTKANVREWRHIFKLRHSKYAHPQMQALMGPLLAEVKQIVPVVFDDLI